MAERRTVSQQIKVFHPWSEQALRHARQTIHFLPCQNWNEIQPLSMMPLSF